MHKGKYWEWPRDSSTREARWSLFWAGRMGKVPGVASTHRTNTVHWEEEVWEVIAQILAEVSAQWPKAATNSHWQTLQMETGTFTTCKHMTLQDHPILLRNIWISERHSCISSNADRYSFLYQMPFLPDSSTVINNHLTVKWPVQSQCLLISSRKLMC